MQNTTRTEKSACLIFSHLAETRRLDAASKNSNLIVQEANALR